MNALEEKLAFQLYTLMCLLGNNLLVIGIIALDDLGVEINRIDETTAVLVGVDLKRGTAIVKLDFQLFALVEHALELGNRFSRENN